MIYTSDDPRGQSNPQKKVPTGKRFRRWWIYLIMLAILFIPSLLPFFSTSKEITWQQFEKVF